MLWMQTFKCPKCDHDFEELVERNELDEVVVTCIKCNTVAEKVISNPLHHKHVSHSQWRIGHSD